MGVGARIRIVIVARRALSRLVVLGFAPVLLAGCASRATPDGVDISPGPTMSSPTIHASPVPFATASPADVPPGRILFHRSGADGVERYFTINTDGTNETAVYPRDLWIMDLDGHWIGQVTHGPSNYSTYSWAPAG
jgi:hypothetical protein